MYFASLKKSQEVVLFIAVLRFSLVLTRNLQFFLCVYCVFLYLCIGQKASGVFVPLLILLTEIPIKA